MRVRPTVLAIVTALSFVALAAETRAESPVVEKIVALNKAAITSLQAGKHEQAKEQLMEAVVLGKENGLGMHAAMARTYLHLGVLYTDGLKDKEKALRNFGLALKVRPDIEITPTLASKAVQETFAEARGGQAPAAKPAEPAKPAAAPASDKKKEEADKKKAEAEAREREKIAQAAQAQQTQQAREAQEKAKAEAQKAEAQKAQAQKELAQARDTEKKERADRERLQKDLAEKDKQLAEKDKRLAEKDKQLAEKDKQLAEKDRQLAEVNGREKKEREGRERAEKLSQENARIIAETAAREKKERETREKAEKERLAAETREKERSAKEAQQKVARQALVEGPELPASIPQPLFCPTRDEAVVNQELHVHCVPQSHVKAKAVVLYYRPSGVAHFNSLGMERSKKGWWTAAVPAAKVTGKTLQYYVDALGAKDEIAAHHGKATSPNLIILRASAEALSPAREPVAGAAPAKSQAKSQAKSAPTKAARRAPASLRERTKPRR